MSSAARRHVVAAACLAAVVGGLGLSAPGFASSSTASSTARILAPADDPLAVYFRPDAVGRAQLSLALSSCGTERWSVKTAADDDRHRIVAQPHKVSLHYLRHRHTPATKPQTSRVAPVELTTYQVHARLTEYVREADGDYHLVLRDKSGRTIIAEIPDPACVAHISPFKSAIRTARSRMDGHLAVTSDFKTANRRVVVTGVGFFDYFHGQTGMAPDDLELHPVTGLRFR